MKDKTEHNKELEAKIHGWEKQFEDILCEMTTATNYQGLLFNTNFGDLVGAFCRETARMRKSMDEEGYTIIHGTTEPPL